jgi:hypothetical protein
MYAAASHGYDAGAMQARALLLAVPSMAMAVVGLAMFGPGAVQPFDGARIRGGPTLGLRHLSWRMTVLQRFRSIDSTRNIGRIVLRARHGEAPEVVARCHTNGDGTCDVLLDFPSEVSGPIHAVITAESTGAILAEGDLQGNAAEWGRAPGHPARLVGHVRGNLSIDVAARRGVFAVPFLDDLVVTVRDGETPLRGAEVTLRTDAANLQAGATWNGPETSITILSSDSGEVSFRVVPNMHVVEVDVEVTAPGRNATWHGALPVVPGAFWLDPNLGSAYIRIMSPVPRDMAYVTLATPSARLWGGAIPLPTTDAQGFAHGQIDVLGVASLQEDPREPKWITISSDPLQTSAGTVGWPICAGICDERPFRDLLLLDGMPAAEKRDERRRYRARTLAAVALGAAAIFEGVFLAHASRARGIRAWAWTTIAIATVALAFAAIGVVVMWKTGG